MSLLCGFIIGFILGHDQTFYVPEGQTFLYAYQTIIGLTGAVISAVVPISLYLHAKIIEKEKYKNLILSNLEDFIKQSLVAQAQYRHTSLGELFLENMGHNYFYYIQDKILNLKDPLIAAHLDYKQLKTLNRMIRCLSEIERILNEVRDTEKTSLRIKRLSQNEIKTASMHTTNFLTVVLSGFEFLAPELYKKCLKDIDYQLASYK